MKKKTQRNNIVRESVEGMMKKEKTIAWLKCVYIYEIENAILRLDFRKLNRRSHYYETQTIRHAQSIE